MSEELESSIIRYLGLGIIHLFKIINCRHTKLLHSWKNIGTEQTNRVCVRARHAMYWKVT